MESEEFEQIPWSNLVAEQDDGIDRRIYLAVGAVGLLVIAVLGMRLFGAGAQPVPPQLAGLELPPTSVAAAEPMPATPTSMIIAEADLRVEEPAAAQASDILVEATAEWFVTDWFTRDGSQETVRSIKAALSSSVVPEAIPHETEGEPVTFVEWARTIASEVTPDGFDITVAYRAIRETEGGFVRDPVRIVVLTVERNDSGVRVVSLPRAEGG
ncbi:MAG: hypothetical protein ACC683_03375 [Acidimicrobiia bacterium]